jgi:hypothetical protein
MHPEPVTMGFKFDVRREHPAPDHVVAMVCAKREDRDMGVPWQLYTRFPPSMRPKGSGALCQVQEVPAHGSWSAPLCSHGPDGLL